MRSDINFAFSQLLSLVFPHYFNCGYDYKVYAIESNNDRGNTTIS